MPPKAEILSHARSLKGYTWALEPTGNEDVWTGKEHGATFELSKPEGTIFDQDMSNFLLILKGKLKGKKQLEENFIEVFGQPTLNWPAKRFCRPQMLYWNAEKALNPQAK